MLEIMKKEIPYDYEVKERLEFICRYANRNVEFYNEIINDLQTKIKTCKIIEDNHKRMEKEIELLDLNNKEVLIR